jgi:hypothetical protein
MKPLFLRLAENNSPLQIETDVVLPCASLAIILGVVRDGVSNRRATIGRNITIVSQKNFVDIIDVDCGVEPSETTVINRYYVRNRRENK